MNDFAAQFRDAVQAFLERTATPPTRLGQQALGDPSFESSRNCRRHLDVGIASLRFRAEFAGIIGVYTPHNNGNSTAKITTHETRAQPVTDEPVRLSPGEGVAYESIRECGSRS